MSFDPKKFHLSHEVTLEKISSWASNPTRECVYAVHSPWWSLFEESFMPYRCPGTKIPCDPRGSVLMQGNLKKLWQHAMKNSEHYGRNGIAAFVAAFHGNVIVVETELPTSLNEWDAYNTLLDLEAAGFTRTKETGE